MFSVLSMCDSFNLFDNRKHWICWWISFSQRSDCLVRIRTQTQAIWFLYYQWPCYEMFQDIKHSILLVVKHIMIFWSISLLFYNCHKNKDLLKIGESSRLKKGTLCLQVKAKIRKSKYLEIKKKKTNFCPISVNCPSLQMVCPPLPGSNCFSRHSSVHPLWV